MLLATPPRRYWPGFDVRQCCAQTCTALLPSLLGPARRAFGLIGWSATLTWAVLAHASGAFTNASDPLGGGSASLQTSLLSRH